MLPLIFLNKYTLNMWNYLVESMKKWYDLNVQHTFDEKNHETTKKKEQKSEKKNSSKVLTNQHILVRIKRVIRTFSSQFWRKSCIIFKNHENVKKNTSDLNFSVIFQITFQPDSALEIRSPSFTKGTFSPSWKWDEGDDEGVPFVPFVYTSLCVIGM